MLLFQGLKVEIDNRKNEPGRTVRSLFVSLCFSLQTLFLKVLAKTNPLKFEPLMLA